MNVFFVSLANFSIFSQLGEGELWPVPIESDLSALFGTNNPDATAI
ncbi:MAG: hypothetical protein AAGA60_05305 [Cyanobacteria bacterium P01_E01_bin.42]